MKRNHVKGEKNPILKGILSFFFPSKCPSCLAVGQEGLCPACARDVEAVFEPKKYLAFGGNGFADEMMALFPYEHRRVKRMLFDWKRVDYEDLREIFGEYLERAAGKKGFWKGIDVVTFAPRRQKARKEAGFDQAEELAKEFSRRTGIPFEGLLKRKGFSRPQHRMKGEGREENVKGAFVPLRELEGETVLLIDDIVTTGASVRECARVLKEKGAMKVYVLSLAH